MRDENKSKNKFTWQASNKNEHWVPLEPILVVSTNNTWQIKKIYNLWSPDFYVFG